jgi:hypothetical protein
MDIIMHARHKNEIVHKNTDGELKHKVELVESDNLI